MNPKSSKSKHTYFDANGDMIDGNYEILHIKPESLNVERNNRSNEDDSTKRKKVRTCRIKKNKCRDKKNKYRAMKKNVKNIPAEMNNRTLLKYWHKRFSLFNKFDEGIILDRESWYSVTPEKIAKHTAERCQCNIIIDAFCGAGSNSIHFASTCERVIAIDIDPKKISMAQNNAKIYGVENRIEFIIGDFLDLCCKLKADIVFLSPPWGGPNYTRVQSYDLEIMLQPIPLSELMKSAKKITKNLVLYLPRHSNTDQLISVAEPGNTVEIEKNFLDRKLVALTAYYGDLIRNKCVL